MRSTRSLVLFGLNVVSIEVTDIYICTEASFSFSAFLQKLKLHYRIHSYPPPICIQSRMSAVHTLISCCLQINFNINLSYTTASSKWYFPFRLTKQNIELSHLILLDLIVATVFVDKYN